MSPEEARQVLLASLIKVRRRMDDDADDWRYSLLDVFKKYCLAIGIGRPFIDPIIKMFFEAHKETTRSRRRAEGKAGTPMPEGRRAALILAAGAVTVLNERQVKVPDAVKAVARATGIDCKKIETFRDELHRLKYGSDVDTAYKNAIVKIRSWPPEIMLDGLGGLGVFVP